MKGRHALRQAALQALVMSLLNESMTPEEALLYIQKDVTPRLTTLDFAEELLKGLLNNREEIDAKIAHFAPEFPVEKLDPIERCALEMGIFELLYTETPAPVVINEAVEMGKEFGDETAGKFINGVLSAVAKDFKARA